MKTKTKIRIQYLQLKIKKTNEKALSIVEVGNDLKLENLCKEGQCSMENEKCVSRMASSPVFLDPKRRVQE